MQKLVIAIIVLFGLMLIASLKADNVMDLDPDESRYYGYHYNRGGYNGYRHYGGYRYYPSYYNSYNNRGGYGGYRYSYGR